ncbi:hypothetical protein KFL_002310140 [Klebsormidium nitens]|uniref:Uncharacterized protein n=1 Tax=Klebsormidium nitens TaxID=105231 RepID=A0A1Y1IB83_KLENI|nr:hypothetical protein KFL_002310140 [Klebsormidium nitens]|eukprot:GAQ85358.1 hypothetical protein KFL_002310140 [Klebsormidium nitens]
MGQDSIWYCIADACFCKPLAQDVGLRGRTGCEREEAARRKSKRCATTIECKELNKDLLVERSETSASMPQVAKRQGRKRSVIAGITEAAPTSASGPIVEQRTKCPRVAHPTFLAETNTSSTSLPVTTNLCPPPGSCGEAVPVVENIPTRAMAEAVLIEKLVGLVARGRRVLLGFDFSLGFSRGFAAALAEKIRLNRAAESIANGSLGGNPACVVDRAEVMGKSGGSGDPCPGWETVWQYLHQHVVDEDNNSNNRFEVAARLNELVSGSPYPFWGCPPSRASPFLCPKKQLPLPSSPVFPEKRAAESRCTAQTTWKLYTTGAVGSQTLLGIPRVFNIRHHPDLRDCTRVWPFETGLRPPGESTGHSGPSIVMAEAYPSLVPPVCVGKEPKDAGQVRALASHFAALDAAGQLEHLFYGPFGPPETDEKYSDRKGEFDPYVP